MADPITRLRSSIAARYTLLQEIGRGGMALVYAATDRKHDRQVALKVLHPHYAAAIGPERFLREIRIAASLSHPHILPVYDSGTVDDCLWFTMPLIETGTLRQRLTNSQALPVDVALRIAREVALALQHAHDRGVIHRDVKPGNVLLTADDTALLGDFGIAKPSASPDTRLTEPGVSLGTVGYMSPEQSTGSEVVDPSSDTYALACMTYEMLAGELPFTGPNQRAVLSKQISAPVPHIRHVRPQVSVAVDAALRKALSPLARDRFPTVREFSQALLAPAPAPGTHTIAVLPFTNLSADPDNEYFSDGITEEIINALGVYPSIRVASRTSSFAFRGSNASVAEMASQLQVTTILEGSVRWSASRIRIMAELVNAEDGHQLWSGRYDREVTDVFAIQEDIARSIVGALRGHLDPAVRLRRSTADTRDIQAYHLYLKGRHAVHAVELGQAVGHFASAIERDPSYARAHAGLADTYSSLGFYGLMPSLEALRRARAEAETAIALDDTLGEGHEALGKVEIYFGWDFFQMERSFLRAISISPGNPIPHAWYALGLTFQGRLEEAEHEVELAFALEPAGPGGAVIALIQICAGKPVDALETCRRILEFNPRSVQALWAAGMAHIALDQAEAAVPLLEQAVGLTSGSSPILGALGSAFAKAGRHSEARAILREIEKQASASHVPATALAWIHFYLGQEDRVFPYLEKVFAQRDTWAICVTRWPGWEGVRNDPRYLRMLHASGLAGAIRQ